MARKPRIHFPGAFYHVIARGNRLQKIFLADGDYELYLSFLREYKNRYRFFLYAYTLMPNHIHLLIEVNQTPLSRLMQSLQFRYTRNFNIKYRKWGHLFQGRYKAILCQKDSYFLELSAYIHLNAVRAGLVKDPWEYPWSSYPHYVKNGKPDGLVDTDFLLAQFSDRNATARKEYARFVKGRLSDGHREDLYELKDQSFLGSEEFVERVQRFFNDQPRHVHDISLEEIVSKASSVLRVPTDLFYTSSRNRRGAWGRSVAGYLARKLNAHQVKTVAEHFNRDPAVISQGMKRLERQIREEKVIARQIAILEEAVTGKDN